MATGQMADVIVVGAGVFGLSCAFACLARGLSVTVLEAGQIGSGASGGIVGAMAPHSPDGWNSKKQFQYEALTTAKQFWAEVDAKSGLSSGFGRIGRWVPIMDARERKLAEQRIGDAARFWQGKYDWNIIECPTIIAPETAPLGVVFEGLAARIFPARAVASLGGAVRAMGGQVLENHPVTEVGENTVSGPWGRAMGGAIILAGGTEGFDLMNRLLGCETGVGVKGQAALLDATLNGIPQIYADGVYIVPHEGGGVAVGSTSEATWTEARATDAQLDNVIARACAICPQLSGAAVLHRWAGLRPKARRRNPMLGPLPNSNSIYAANGAFKIGFGIANRVGKVMADMITGTPSGDVIPEGFTVDWQIAPRR